MAQQLLVKPPAYTPDNVRANYDANIDAANANDAELYAATGAGTTGALRVPPGTTAQRPGSPTAGMLRFNTTTSKMEYYNGTAWVALG